MIIQKTTYFPLNRPVNIRIVKKRFFGTITDPFKPQRISLLKPGLSFWTPIYFVSRNNFIDLVLS